MSDFIESVPFHAPYLFRISFFSSRIFYFILVVAEAYRGSSVYNLERKRNTRRFSWRPRHELPQPRHSRLQYGMRYLGIPSFKGNRLHDHCSLCLRSATIYTRYKFSHSVKFRPPYIVTTGSQVCRVVVTGNLRGEAFAFILLLKFFPFKGQQYNLTASYKSQH